MLAKWQFWLVTVLVPIATLILFGATKLPLMLWCGGFVLFFWVNGRIRESISDNFYINVAYTTLTAAVLLIPQIFYIGTVSGWVLFALTLVYQTLALFTNLDYTSDYTVGRDISRNWRSETKTNAQKIYGHYVIAQANWAAIILCTLAFLFGAAAFAFCASQYGHWLLFLSPLYTLLWHLLARAYMWLNGIPAPTGQHEKVTNIPQGFWFLIWSVLRTVLLVLASPFILIAYVCRCIAKFFAGVKNGGTATISKFFWICTCALGVYLILSLFNIADVIPRIFGNFGGIDLEIKRFLFPITEYVLDLDLELGFFLDVLLFIPKLILYLLCFVLDLVLLLVVTIGWLLLNLLIFLIYILLVVSFELILPIALAIGAVVFLILYLIESDRDFFDWCRTVIFASLPTAATVLYFLLRTGVIPTLI